MDEFYIDGTVFDNEGIKAVYLDDHEIDIAKGKEAYFSHLVKLSEGENKFTLKVCDLKENCSTKVVTLIRDQASGKLISNRIAVSCRNFEIKGEVPVLLKEKIEVEFLKVLKNSQRFQIYEREYLDEILTEQKIASSSLADRKNLVQISGIIPADILLFSDIIGNDDGADVYIDVVEVENPSEPVAVLNVFHPGKDIKDADWTARGLCLKLLDEFPLVEGIVLGTNKNDVLTSLNLSQRVRPGTFLYVIREGEKLIVDGEDFGAVETDVGTLRITKVDEKKSYTQKIELKEGLDIEKGDIVITK
jgi:hypothetical protein